MSGCTDPPADALSFLILLKLSLHCHFPISDLLDILVTCLISRELFSLQTDYQSTGPSNFSASTWNKNPVLTPMSNQAAADSFSRKRSRSPEEVDDKYASQPNSKRQNTGLASSGSSGAFDVAMSESQDIKPSIPAPQASHASSVELVDKPKDLPPKPEPATAAAAEDGQKAAGGSNSATPAAHLIHMRCLIVTQDASIIIGKGGAHVNEIREKSGSKVMVSESIPGNPERILNVSGALDAVSKVCTQLLFERHEAHCARLLD